jgi:hypothetical protein
MWERYPPSVPDCPSDDLPPIVLVLVLLLELVLEALSALIEDEFE